MTLRHAATPLLDTGYLDQGPADGPVVLLLHGWPDDATTWDGVAPALADAGLRTIAPWLRGFGPTRFLSADSQRTGNTAILAHDAIHLMDALGIERFMVAGHDWGSNVAETLAVGWPERVARIAMLSTQSRLGSAPTPPFRQAQLYWYHWFQATRRGAEAVRQDPKGFARLMWDNWSPPGWYDEAMFAAVAKSWESPDWPEVTIHAYRTRWDEAEPDPSSAALDAKVKATGQLPTPTLYVHGLADGVNPPEASAGMERKFSGRFRRVSLDRVGHFPTREAPDAVAEALVAHFG